MTSESTPAVPDPSGSDRENDSIQFSFYRGDIEAARRIARRLKDKDVDVDEPKPQNSTDGAFMCFVAETADGDLKKDDVIRLLRKDPKIEFVSVDSVVKLVERKALENRRTITPRARASMRRDVSEVLETSPIIIKGAKLATSLESAVSEFVESLEKSGAFLKKTRIGTEIVDVRIDDLLKRLKNVLSG